MAAVTQEKEKKSFQRASAAKAAISASAMANDKAELGALLRPDVATSGRGLEVGADNDKAERQADAVAEVVTSDAPVEAESVLNETEAVDDESDVALNGSIRGPPGMLHDIQLQPAIRRTTAQGGQPHMDSLSSAPALPSNMSEVDVAADEEADLGAISQNDWNQLSAGESIQPKRSTGSIKSSFHISQSLSEKIRNPVDTGSPLPSSLCKRMESRLGLDLSRVRVHTGSEAKKLCLHIGAKAFAHRHHIWLRSSVLLSDNYLLAHEVAHTIQQGSATRLQRPSHIATRPSLQGSKTARGPPQEVPQAQTMHPVRRLAEGEQSSGLLERGAERLADRLDSYGVLKVITGKRLFTGETLHFSAVDYVGAFMKFVGANDTFEQMKQSGSLERGFAQIKEGLTTYNLTWARVRQTFSRASEEFDWLSPIDSFTSIFGPFFRDVVAYGANVLKIIAELVAEAFVVNFGPLGQSVWEKIKAIGDVIGLVLDNPLGFAMNLIRAVSRGIQGFGERIWEHIKAGLLAWILGPFAAMGIRIPDVLDLKGIVSVILQVLGLTYPQLRPRIVRAMNPNGEIKVTFVERLIEAVNILRTEGLAGIWRKLMEYVENLQVTVINGIRDWVVRAVVQAGIRKLVAWSNPAGALLDILLTIYNLIVFFVQRFQQILDFASSVFESIGKIARGQLNDAALAVENSLKLTIPIIISFMVRLLGLPDITGTIRRIVTNLRARVHAAFDRVLNWIIKKIKKLVAKFVNKFKRQAGEDEMPVNMQGENHMLKLESESNGRKLYMHSERTEFSASHLRQQAEPMEQKCAEPLTTELKTNLDAACVTLAAGEQREAATATQPVVNQETADKKAERQQHLEATKTHVEAGTTPQVRATQEVRNGTEDPDDQPDDNDVTNKDVSPEQKPFVEADLEDPVFRYVLITPTVASEGYYGPWKDVKSSREGFAAEVTRNGEDPRWLVELDHNPEHQILWRLAFLEYPEMPQRDKEDPPPTGPMFPSLRALYRSPPTSEPRMDRDKGEGALAMGVRYDAHREVPNTQTANVSTFRSMTTFNADKKVFEPKSDANLDTHAFNSGHWWSQIASGAGEHLSVLIAAYRELERGLHVAPETVEAVTRNGPDMIRASEQFVTGQTSDVPLQAPGVAGWMGGVAMKPDPVAAELDSGSYGEVNDRKGSLAPQFGSTLDTHHMIEERVLEKIREHFSNVRLTEMVKEQQAGLGEMYTMGPTQPYETFLSATAALRSNEMFAGFDFESEWRRIFNASGFNQVSVFSNRNIHREGYAVSVLHQVNAAAGTTPPEHSKRNASRELTAVYNDSIAAMNVLIRNAYAGVDTSAIDSVERAEATMTEVRLSLRSGLQQEHNQSLPAPMRNALTAVVGNAAEAAQSTFVRNQESSYREVFPQDKSFKSGSEAETVYNALMERWRVFESADLIRQENLQRWLN